MTRLEFVSYRETFAGCARQALADEASPILSEAAFPAYTNGNPLIRFLFWQRIRRVMRHLQDRQFERAVDFGCGGGVMLPFLAARAHEVRGLDIDLSPHRLIARQLRFPAHVSVESVIDHPLTEITSRSCDVILALDVLEHVSDLRDTIDTLMRILRPGGELIVSGPTENIFYKLGRRFAGAEYSGDYHVRDIYAIQAELERAATVRTLATLYYPFPLFKLYSVTSRSRTIAR